MSLEGQQHVPTHPHTDSYTHTHTHTQVYESHSNQMMEDGETVTSLVEAYNKKKADKRAAEDKEEERLSKAGAEGGEGGGMIVCVCVCVCVSKEGRRDCFVGASKHKLK